MNCQLRSSLLQFPYFQSAKDIKNKRDEKLKNETEIKYEASSFEGDTGSNNSGYYELQAVLTHQGRSSSSGHYVAWVKHKQGTNLQLLLVFVISDIYSLFSSDNWIKCDDDKLSIVQEEDVLKLSGGGDWHVAYTLLYGPKRCEVWEEEAAKPEEEAAKPAEEKMQE